MSEPLGRILVVDDEPQVAAMLRDLLMDLGYGVKNAMNGQEALSLVPVYRPDVVMLDLTMPGLPGHEVLEHLRRVDPHLPVIIVTANRDLDVARRTLMRGAFDYVLKPFELEVLARIVAAAIVHRSPHP
jgi:DNA-binding NtrC family response regulator